MNQVQTPGFPSTQRRARNMPPVGVGMPVYMPFSSSHVYDSDNGAEYLLSGFSTGTVGKYVKAALNPNLQVIGNQVFLAAGTARTITQVASNGTGTIVICYGDTTNVQTSTDYGLNWTARAHNLGGTTYAATGVSWDATNAVFICCGNVAASHGVATSVDGVTWVNRTAATGISSATVSTARIFTTAAGVSLINCAGTITGAARSTNSTSWTAVTLASICTTNCLIAHNANGVWLTCSTGDTNGNTSADATSWAAATMPATFVHLAGGNSLFLGGEATSSAPWRSLTGATSTWAANTFGKLGMNVAGAFSMGSTGASGGIQFGNGVFVLTSSVRHCAATTADGINFTFKTMSSPAGTSVAYVWGSGLTAYSLSINYASSSIVYYSRNFSYCDSVGTPVNVPATSDTNLATYYRIF